MTEARSVARPKLRERLYRAWARLRGGSLSPARAAASVGVGLFVACMPFYGAQLLLVLLLCVPLRLDSALAYIVTHVSNPITLPIFLWFELELGSAMMTGKTRPLHLAELKHIGLVTAGTQIALGAAASAVTLGSLGALLTWVVAHRLRDIRQQHLAQARRRTLARYQAAPRSARSYVGIKLRTDPALEAIARLPGDFGRVVDAGAGYFQIGLCLLEMGRIATLTGFDADPVRVAVARDAARTDANIEEADLTRVTFPEADTVLFVDSLHYVPREAQCDVLERAARALAPGGRLVVRDVDSGASVRSGFTERLERNAAKKRGGAEGLAFRSSAEIAGMLEGFGLTPTIVQHDDLSIVHNALVVGRKRSEPS